MSVDYIHREFGWMVGKTVADVYSLSSDEILEMGWYESWGQVPFIVEFTDGTCIIPSSDPEGNGPGFLISGN